MLTDPEKKHFPALDKDCMTEESDSETTDTIILHKHLWRSESELLLLFQYIKMILACSNTPWVVHGEARSG